jgi:hypothetical protein
MHLRESTSILANSHRILALSIARISGYHCTQWKSSYFARYELHVQWKLLDILSGSQNIDFTVLFSKTTCFLSCNGLSFQLFIQALSTIHLDIEMLVNSEGIPCPLTSDQTNLTRWVNIQHRRTLKYMSSTLCLHIVWLLDCYWLFFTWHPQHITALLKQKRHHGKWLMVDS